MSLTKRGLDNYDEPERIYRDVIRLQELLANCLGYDEWLEERYRETMEEQKEE